MSAININNELSEALSFSLSLSFSYVAICNFPRDC